ncbi:unnamed protein product [Discosporangium mesarthrocarpum]
MANLPETRFDEVLMTMAGQTGGVEALLSTFFSFLHRNTDFYVTFDAATTLQASMGFPKGKAEAIVLNTFRSFPYKEYRDGIKPGPSESSDCKGRKNPEEVTTTRPDNKGNKDHPVTTVSDRPSESGIARNTFPLRTASSSEQSQPPHDGGPSSTGGLTVRYTEDGKQIPIGNGGVTPTYYWTQTLYEATVYADVPKGTRSSDVTCQIGPRKLYLRLKGEGEPIIDGDMPGTVSRDGSLWSLVDGNTVVISLEKSQKTWWKSVVEGDPEIDATKVDSTSKISDYDDQTQGAIRKIMFDQRQKTMGLPTSDEITTENTLEMAKRLPGSPFLPGGAYSEGEVHTEVGGRGVS